MTVFALNTLSVGQQCYSDAEIRATVSALIEGIDFVWPAVQSERVKLVYDSRIEAKELLKGELLLATISRLNSFSDNGTDLIKKWYLYTKKRAEDVTDEGVEITVECINGSFPAMAGTVSNYYIDDAANWLSFGSWPAGVTDKYVVTTPIEKIHKNNACDKTGVRRLVPIYQPSPKHRFESYWDHQRSELVAAMPLDADTAQRVLLAGISHNNDIFSLHAPTNSLYRFVLTRGNEYHGFQVRNDEVPHICLRQLGI